MIVTMTALPGVALVDVERHEDERGFFARTFCARELAKAGLPAEAVQCSVSFNARRHTLRGMHWQVAPAAEDKLVRCTRGAILDVAVDLRRGTPTYLKHVAVELDENNHRALLVPKGVAHGFLTLVDETEVYYQMNAFYEPSAARGARWDDPSFGIRWPFPPQIISDRDRGYSDYPA